MYRNRYFPLVGIEERQPHGGDPGVDIVEYKRVFGALRLGIVAQFDISYRPPLVCEVYADFVVFEGDDFFGYVFVGGEGRLFLSLLGGEGVRGFRWGCRALGAGRAGAFFRSGLLYGRIVHEVHRRHQEDYPYYGVFLVHFCSRPRGSARSFVSIKNCIRLFLRKDRGQSIFFSPPPGPAGDFPRAQGGGKRAVFCRGFPPGFMRGRLRKFSGAPASPARYGPNRSRRGRAGRGRLS